MITMHHFLKKLEIQALLKAKVNFNPCIGKILEHTLTTNGTNLSRYASTLKNNGVERINVSLDSLNPESFKKITKWGDLSKVLNGKLGQTGGYVFKIEEVEKETGKEFKKQHQGADNLRKYFEENPEIGKYIFFKFRDTLKKS